MCRFASTVLTGDVSRIRWLAVWWQRVKVHQTVVRNFRVLFFRRRFSCAVLQNNSLSLNTFGLRLKVHLFRQREVPSGAIVVFLLFWRCLQYHDHFLLRSSIIDLLFIFSFSCCNVYCYLSVFLSKVANFVGLLPVLAACHTFCCLLVIALANKDWLIDWWNI